MKTVTKNTTKKSIKVGDKGNVVKDTKRTPAPKTPAAPVTPKPTTTKIQIRVAGTLRGPNWKIVKREFETVKDAKEYLIELKVTSINGTTAKVMKDPGASSKHGDATVETNYDVTAILAGKAPKGPLPVIMTVDELKTDKLVMPRNSEAGKDVKKPEAAVTPKAESKKPATSNLVPLKTICADLKIEPREARIALRSLSKAKKLPVAHDAQGRWEWEPGQVAELKKVLTAKLAAAKE